MADPLLIDGSFGEGGGQILRSSLALSAITGKPCRIYNIRANRPKGGLRRQHLTAVRAAAAICSAAVTGDAVDSRELEFRPGAVRAGEYHFDVGSAGSTMLVLQTVLPPLMMADGPSLVTLEGGTHNFGAPPFPFLAKAFLPLIGRMGPRVEIELERAGFAPQGGGRAVVQITPAPLKRIELEKRGAVRRRVARATVAGLPRDIARRELDVVAEVVGLGGEELEIEELPADQGPGNLVAVEVESEHVTEVFAAFGQRGVRAERVAQIAAEDARRYLAADVPVGECLADQLLLPMALAGGGSFVTLPLSMHAKTNVETICTFLPDVRVDVAEVESDRVKVIVTH